MLKREKNKCDLGKMCMCMYNKRTKERFACICVVYSKIVIVIYM